MPRPRHSPRERRARDDSYRSSILEAAEALFAEQGYADTRMQDVAEAAQTSLRTVYRLFPSKTDLYSAINARRGAEIVEATFEVVQGFTGPEVVNPLAMMLRGMAVYLRFFTEHPAYLEMSLREGYVWYHGSATPGAEQRRWWERGRDMLVAGMRWGIDAGLFVDDDPEDMARTMTALHQTRLANWILAGARAPAGEVVAAAQAEFVRTFCRPAYAAALLTAGGTRPSDAALAPDRPLPPPEEPT